MSRHIVTLANDRLRSKALDYVRAAKPGSRVEFKGPKRSNDQNAAMWAMLSDLSRSLVWHGHRLDTEAWKLVFIDALRREHKDQIRLVPNIDLTGFVNVSSTSSSDLSHDEMRDLLTIIRAFGDQQGVVWSEPAPKDNRPATPIEAYEDFC
ncbi:recombination protein NinB [Devosia algicola]|uniref:Recombination protein NinB n=1 Tax=Devosia algicola TaxID=3026418 RepID=A0ABY7YS06_9HYPH|nr:recombination protein NinB [Devosia algicola]WDR03660.1 recombination protein NinB [Devosia algicola]